MAGGQSVIKMTDQQQITHLYETYWQAMIAKDIPLLKDIMAKDYHLFHMTGVKQSREEFISGLVAGTFNYYSAHHEAIEVHVNQDIATMKGKSVVVAAVYGGGKHRWHLQGDFTLRKENGAWKLTGSRASTY